MSSNNCEFEKKSIRDFLLLILMVFMMGVTKEPWRLYVISGKFIQHRWNMMGLLDCIYAIIKFSYLAYYLHSRNSRVNIHKNPGCDNLQRISKASNRKTQINLTEISAAQPLRCKSFIKIIKVINSHGVCVIWQE
jgi:hypothetical protein